MSADWTLAMGHFCEAMALAAPVYLVVFRSRFWAAFIAAWFFLFAAVSFSVLGQWMLYDEGLLPRDTLPPETTDMGIVMFSGWVIALPYCLVLKLVRGILRRYDLMKPLKADEAVEHTPADS